ncbi:uncharacterized protein PG986_010382 [Apiospora aurea]|uniref:Uncharacterized protein n=1 Tax=Apiospora aurea TaxID=335848 RepID=A0ABR1Q2J0_9PEZI
MAMPKSPTVSFAPEVGRDFAPPGALPPPQAEAACHVSPELAVPAVHTKPTDMEVVVPSAWRRRWRRTS